MEQKPHVDGAPTDTTIVPAQDFARRRQVIKGLSSVPVVATLTSGFSAAAASILQCAANAQPPTEQSITIRKQQVEGEDGANENQAPYAMTIFSRDPIGCTMPEGRVNEIGAYEFSGTATFPGGGSSSTPDILPNHFLYYMSSSTGDTRTFTLLNFYVDENGNLDTTSCATPLLASCHNSLLAHVIDTQT